MRQVSLISLLFTFIIILGGCKNDDAGEMSVQQQKLQLLRNGEVAWVVGMVEKDGFDVTDQFTDFKLIVGEFTYSVQNASSSAWPNNSGTWAFADEDGTQIIRDNNVTMDVDVTENSLRLAFNSDASSGRKASIDGQYIFDLISE